LVQIPFADLPPLPLGLIWRTNHVNARIVAFAAFAAARHADQSAPPERGPRPADIKGTDGNELRTFLTLADELHFARAAERLRLTPSRASQLIRKLESRIGAPLFDRTSRRVQLTPLGHELRGQLQSGYEQLAAAETR
jgi:hypothetical protein